MPEITPDILKKALIQKGINKGRIKNPLTAQEESNSILELIGRATSDGYNIDRKAKSELRKRSGDYVLTAQAEKTVRAEKEAMTDGLTGLFARGYFDKQLSEELNQAQRLKLPVGLALGDIRRLKDYNDKYGHQMGDTAIVSVAQVLRDSTRKSDIPCRTGGDEVAMIFTVLKAGSGRKNNTKDGLVVATIRKLQNIHTRPMMTPKGTVETLDLDTGITLSTDGDTVKSIYERADNASYLAKKLFHPGEEKVVIATQTAQDIEYQSAEVNAQGKVIYSPIENAQYLVRDK